MLTEHPIDVVSSSFVQRGELEQVMCDWRIADIDVNLITQPGVAWTTRVTALLEILVEHVAHAPWAMSES